MRKVVVVLLLVCGASAGAWADGYPKPGLYKVTAELSSKQLPMTRTHEMEECLSENEFLNDPASWASKQPGQECKAIRADVGGGKVDIELECVLDDGGKARMVGTGTYTSDSYQMTNVMRVQAHGMDVEMNTNMKAVYAGDC